MHTAKLIYGLFSLGFLCTSAFGQRYMIYRLPKLKNEFSVSMYGFGGQRVSFSGLGNIVDPILEDGEYHDGFVKPTYTDTNRDEYVSDSLTQYFDYYSDSQQVTIDGVNYIQYHTYSMEGGASIDGESNGGTGWELGYLRYLDDDNTWALFCGFGFSPVDAEVTRTLESPVRVDSDFYAIDEFPSIGLHVTNDFYFGDIWSPFVKTNTDGSLLTRYLIDLESSFSETTYLDDQEWTGTWSLTGGLTTFRMGPAYKVNLFNHLDMRLKAGIYFSYVDLKFQYNESFTVPDSEEGVAYIYHYLTWTGDLRSSDPTVITRSNEVSAGKWMVGPYVEAKLNYQINQKTSLFSTIEYQTGESVSIENEGRTATIDLGDSYKIKFGIGYTF